MNLFYVFDLLYLRLVFGLSTAVLPLDFNFLFRCYLDVLKNQHA